MTMIAWLTSIMGTELSWRMGRALYMAARGEGPNDMQTNGERLVLERVAEILAREKTVGYRPTVVDCGANLGEWTEMARRVCAAAGITPQYHLLEPEPAAFKSISDRFAGLPEISLHSVALSDAEGSADFYVISPTCGRNSLVDSEHSEAPRTQVSVARGTPYFEARGIERIDFLKIDTEGNDYAVLEGFSEMLREHRIRAVQFEYNFRWLAARHSLRDVFKLAKGHGYRVCKLEGSRIIGYQSWNPELDRFFEWNYLLVSSELASQLNVHEAQWSRSNTLVVAAP